MQVHILDPKLGPQMTNNSQSADGSPIRFCNNLMSFTREAVVLR